MHPASTSPVTPTGSSSLIHPESLSTQGVTAVITEALAGLAIAKVLEARLTDAPGHQGVI